MQAVERRLAHDRARRGARPRRRIGLRQVDARPRHRRHPAAERRVACCSTAPRSWRRPRPQAARRGSRWCSRTRSPRSTRACASATTVAEGPLAHGLVEAPSAAGYVARTGSRRSGSIRTIVEPLSAPVLRRAAPARRDRARARHEARPPRLRRAGRLARRLDPGADHQPVPEAAPRARPDHAVHQPRSRRRAASLRPRRHHVSRPHRRERADARRSTRRRGIPIRKALLEACRSSRAARRRSGRLPAKSPPRPIPPKACPFHPRCPLAVERCRIEPPELRAIVPGRRSACHRAEEVSPPLVGTLAADLPLS